jgi:hypothetical protein
MASARAVSQPVEQIAGLAPAGVDHRPVLFLLAEPSFTNERQELQEITDAFGELRDLGSRRIPCCHRQAQGEFGVLQLEAQRVDVADGLGEGPAELPGGLLRVLITHSPGLSPAGRSTFLRLNSSGAGISSHAFAVMRLEGTSRDREAKLSDPDPMSGLPLRKLTGGESLHDIRELVIR